MRTSIIVQNLKSSGCAQTISTKLSSIKNISDLQIDVTNNKVSFYYNNDEDALEVKAKLKQLGYPSIQAKHRFTSKFISFANRRASSKFVKQTT